MDVIDSVLIKGKVRKIKMSAKKDQEIFTQRLTFCFLGDPILIKEEKTGPSKIRSQRIALLLAYLAVHKGPVKRELLVELLWPEEEKKKKNKQGEEKEIFDKKGRFRVLLNKLKETFPSICNITDEEISLAPEALAQIDVYKSELLKESIEDYKKFVSLYRGDFLAGINIPVSVSMWEWLERQRTCWRDKAQKVLRQLAIYHYEGKRVQDLDQALIYAQRSLEIEPWDDKLQIKVALIYEQKGDYNLAIGQLDRYKELLKKDQIKVPEGVDYLYEKINKKKKQSTLTKTQVINMLLVNTYSS